MNRVAQVLYDVPLSRPGWELQEETVPESDLHDRAVELLKAILAWWARDRADVQVARNLAIRWVEQAPRIGVDPDVCVLSPKPPPEIIDGAPVLTSVRTWEKGHAPPRIAVEVVSPNHPYKDYGEAPEKYAANGTEELWVFDPLLAGPRAQGGPFRLQVWRRDDAGRLARRYAGEGPARSGVLDAWLVPTTDGRLLRVASSPDGEVMWPTEAEAAGARVAELEAELARLRKST